VNRDAAEVSGVALDFARMDACTDLETILERAIADCCRTPHGSCCAIEEGKEAVARRIDLHAAKPIQLDPHSLVVSSQQLFPGRISKPSGYFRGVHDVGDEQGRHEALARLCRLGPSVHAAELDRHKRFVADHSRIVTRRDLKRLASPKKPPRAGVGFDFYFAFEHDALVMMLAAGRPDHRFHMLGPAPPRLVDESGDMNLAEKHDLHRHERKRDELIRLIESRRLEPGHLFRLRLGDSVQPITGSGHRNEHPPSVIASLVASGRKARSQQGRGRLAASHPGFPWSS
jgi:hypothetical protein